MTRRLQQGRYAERIGVGCGVFMAATIEYLTREIMDLAGMCAKKGNRKRIDPRDIQIAIRNDSELNKLIC